MITRWPCTLLVTLCLLLAVAPSASAEYAWIMWIKWLNGETSPQGSYDNHKQCEETVVRYYAMAKRDAREKEVIFIGFPDTIDPRGSNGK